MSSSQQDDADGNRNSNVSSQSIRTRKREFAGQAGMTSRPSLGFIAASSYRRGSLKILKRIKKADIA